MSQIFSLIDDFTETILFLSDLVNIPQISQNITDTICNALINFSYQPMLLNSLVGTETIESDPPLSINTSLYILVSTLVHFKGSRTDVFYDRIISNLMSPKVQN